MEKNQAEQAREHLHTDKYRGRNKLEHGKEVEWGILTFWSIEKETGKNTEKKVSKLGTLTL